MGSRTSIALATHNGERYLREQLASFKEQTILPDELIVSDDASDDATAQILKDFALSAPFKLRILPFTDRLGYAGNFNRAMLATTGDLVFLCDQDDVWFPTKLETMLAEARTHPDAMVLMNDVSLTDSSLAPAGITKLEQFRSAGISVDRYLMGAAAAVRREFLEAVMPVPTGYPAHDDWIIKLAIGIGRRHLLPIPLQYYRIHGSNTSRFRVNSLRRVSPLSVSRSRLDQLLRGKPLEIDQDRLALLTLESSGAKRASEHASGQLSADFDRLAQRLSERMIVMQRRLAVRGLPRLERIGKIRELLREGGYSAYRGYASALLDFLAPVAP
ncbi:MAG TPA: glycosyltransferase family 2 protein [Trueperaceae bacterium]|nr:glycosyltransferase family 2 protein [Trueperaceae bacterium]